MGDGLVAYYPFDEGEGDTAADGSGSSNDGTVHGGATWAPGRFGGALSLDGVDDEVAVPHDASLDLTDQLTLAAWVRLAPPAGGQHAYSVFSKDDGAVGVLDGTTWAFEFGVWGDGSPFSYSTGVAEIVGSGGTLTDGGWHHLAMTKSGSQLVYYVDGQPAGSFADGRIFPASPFDLHLGSNHYAAPEGPTWFAGTLDEVRIYARPLTAAEVQALFEGDPLAEPPPPPSCDAPGCLLVGEGLVAYYPFDEGGGDVAVDASASANHGSVHGGAAWTPGRFGGALSFDGIDDEVAIPHDASLDLTDELTLAAWVQLVPPVGGQPAYAVFSKDDGTAGGPDGTTWAFEFGVWGDGSPFSYSTGVAEIVGSGGALADGGWHHLAMTKHGSDLVYYVDGQPAGSFADDRSFPASPYDLHLGADHFASPDGATRFSGSLDEVRIYDRSLSANEIQTLFEADAERPVSCTRPGCLLPEGLVAYYPFDEGGGATVRDASGYGHDGSLEGARWAAGRFGGGLSFDGVDDEVVVPHSPTLDVVDDLTLAAWIRIGLPDRGQVQSYGSLLAKDDGAPGLAAGAWDWAFAVRRNGRLFSHAQGAPDVDGTRGLAKLVWHHVALTRSGGQLSYYVDGQPADGFAAAPPFSASPFDLHLGADHRADPQGTSHFSGSMDEVRIYDRALSDAELQTLYEGDASFVLPAELRVPQASDWADEGPTLAAGPPGSWDLLLAAVSPCGVVEKDGTYFLYYIGADGFRSSDGEERHRALGVATSQDGFEFTKYAGSPIVTHLPHANEEEGVFSCAPALDGDQIVLYYGALWAQDSTSDGVDIHIRMARSQDGLSFSDDQLILARPGSELSPLGAFRAADGTWNLYYLDSEPGTWDLHLLRGDDPASLAEAGAVITDGDVLGGGSVAPLSGDDVVVFLQRGSFDAPFVEARRATGAAPGTSSPEESYSFSDFFHLTVFLDPTAGLWRMFHMDDVVGSEIRQKTAPIQAAPP